MAETGMWLGIAAALLSSLPLAWKWQLGLARVALTIVCLGLVVGIVTGPIVGTGWILRAAAVWAFTLIIASLLLLFRFYSDPDRHVPLGPALILSPADGKVIYIRECRSGELPVCTKQGRHYRLSELTKSSLCTDHIWQIGISMNFLDVHVNRAPIEGWISFQKHFAGTFGSLRKEHNILSNERATTVITAHGREVAIVQIASRLVRNIVSFVHEGQRVKLGQRIGAIRFGSQVDLIVPADDIELCAAVGDHVKAGMSIIARLRPEKNECDETHEELL